MNNEYVEIYHNSSLLEQVSENLYIYQNNDYYFLTKNTDIVGFIKLTDYRIIDKVYKNVELIHINPQFNKIPSIKWILFCVKQLIKQPVIVDNNIISFNNELEMDNRDITLFKLSILNKETGIKIPYYNTNDTNLFYMLEYGDIGFGKQYFPESWKMPYLWYNFMGFIE